MEISLKNIHILVVDDNEDLLEILQFEFENAGAKVTTALSGQVALEKCQGDSSIQIVVSDLNMPKMNGIDLHKNIKTKLNKNLPFILFVSDNSHLQNELEQMGISETFSKPYDSNELHAAIKKFAG